MARRADVPPHDAADDELEGGDAACWAHLFADPLAADDDVRPRVAPTDLAALAREAVAQGPIWTRESADLDVNLLVFPQGKGVAGHINDEVDVLVVGVAGEGVVDIDGRPALLRAGQALLIPKGARRSTRSASDRFAYLTCHRRRGGLRPRV